MLAVESWIYRGEMLRGIWVLGFGGGKERALDTLGDVFAR